ncbi:Uncharacterised protein [Acinetobacter baumannii]|nr:Uncharacterised protein [Acinetobacter baumannii]
MDSGPGSRFGHGRASWGNPHKRLLRPRNAWLEPGLARPRRLFDKDCMAPDNATKDRYDSFLTLSQSMVGLLTLCRCYKTVRLCEKACRLRVEARNGVPLRGR